MTSNSYNYTIDRDTLIRSAFELCHVAVEGETLATNETTVAARTLNVMIKAWVAYGLQVWKRKEFTITPLVASQQFYDLGTPETNSITVTGDASTAVSVAHPYHGYKTGDSVKILGATGDTDINGTFTITVTNPSTYTYTALGAVDSGVEAGATTAQLQGFDDIPRPEKILDVSRIDSSGNAVGLTSLTRKEYDELPNATTTGTPTQYHYERTLGAGRLHLWPTADATAVTAYTLSVVYQARIEDVDSSTDLFDFPPEWLEALTYGLAKRLAPRYGVSLEERQLLNRDARDALDLAKEYDVEEGSIYLQPEARQ